MLRSDGLYVLVSMKRGCTGHYVNVCWPLSCAAIAHIEDVDGIRSYFMSYSSAFAAFQRLVWNILAQMGKAELLYKFQNYKDTDLTYDINK